MSVCHACAHVHGMTDLDWRSLHRRAHEAIELDEPLHVSTAEFDRVLAEFPRTPTDDRFGLAAVSTTPMLFGLPLVVDP